MLMVPSESELRIANASSTLPLCHTYCSPEHEKKNSSSKKRRISIYLISINSTSNMRVALGGMLLPEPRAP